jgi:hypothetical protein
MDSPALAPVHDEWNDEFIASDTLVGRLHRADEQTILQIIAPLAPRQRAGLAAFCYRKSHLHEVGLTIAATCDQLTLIQVLGTAVGTILSTQAHARKAAADRSAGSQRPKITLAKINMDLGPRYIVEDEPVEVEVEDEECELV